MAQATRTEVLVMVAILLGIMIIAVFLYADNEPLQCEDDEYKMIAYFEPSDKSGWQREPDGTYAMCITMDQNLSRMLNGSETQNQD